jgi:hypothetical protein
VAASKRSSVGPVKRGDSGSVPKGGGKPIARKSVAGSEPRRRAEAKADPPSRKVVPAVQQKLAQVGHEGGSGDHSPYPSDRYPRVDPTVLLSAFGRAQKNGAPDNIKWDASRQQWVVPSATDPRRNYRVWRRRTKRGALPFYVLLECNCVAEQSGSYICCWHKCAVKLWLNEWFSKQSFGEQLNNLSTDEAQD